MNKFAKIACIYIATFSVLSIVEYVSHMNRRIAGPSLYLITQEMNQFIRELESIGFFFDQPEAGEKIIQAVKDFKANPTRRYLKKYLKAIGAYKG